MTKSMFETEVHKLSLIKNLRKLHHRKNNYLLYLEEGTFQIYHITSYQKGILFLYESSYKTNFGREQKRGVAA